MVGRTDCQNISNFSGEMCLLTDSSDSSIIGLTVGEDNLHFGWAYELHETGSGNSDAECSYLVLTTEV